MKNTLLGCLLSSLLFGSTAMGADSWHVGTNNLFIQDYLLNQSVGCPTGLTCPTRQSVSLSQIHTYIQSWAGSTTGHIGLYREIVGMAWVAPSCASNLCSDNANWSYIDSVMDEYEAANVYLILTLGNPVPAWADSYATNTNGQCFMPTATDTTNWGTLKNNMAWAIGNYYNHYAGLSTARKTWLQSHVVLESWNEFDAGQSNTTGCNDSSLGTPARNADLSNGIKYVVGAYGLTANFAGASMVGVYDWKGDSRIHNINDSFQYYWADFYTAGGGSAPNIHAYALEDGTEAAIKTKVEGIISATCTGAGTTYCQYMVFGETGWEQQVTGVCSGNFSLPDSIRNNIYTDFTSDTNIGGKVWGMTFWDSVQYPSSQGLGCNGVWGFLNDSSGTALTAGNNLRTYLETH